jgi:flagellar basal-body rod protein FlgB
MSNISVNAVDQVAVALSLAGLRHRIIGSNLANREAQGYERLTLAPGGELSAAAPTTFAGESLARTSLADRGLVKVDTGAPSSLEDDMVALSANTLRYQALVRGLSRYFSIAEAVMNGGRN